MQIGAQAWHSRECEIEGEAVKRFLASLYQTPSCLIALQFAAHGCDSKVSLLAGQGVSYGIPEGSASIFGSVFVDFAFVLVLLFVFFICCFLFAFSLFLNLVFVCFALCFLFVFFLFFVF